MLMTMEDLRKTHTVFSVPMFFIQGEDDNITPTSVVADYVSKIQAPVKNLDIVPGAGHWVMWTHPAEFPLLARRHAHCHPTHPIETATVYSLVYLATRAADGLP